MKFTFLKASQSLHRLCVVLTPTEKAISEARENLFRVNNSARESSHSAAINFQAYILGKKKLCCVLKTL